MIVEKKRHIAKTISYRILSTAIGFFIMWIVSGSIKVGAAFVADQELNLTACLTEMMVECKFNG